MKTEVTIGPIVTLVCNNPSVGEKFWAFVAKPELVKDCNERIKLLAHPHQCEACLREVLKKASIIFNH